MKQIKTFLYRKFPRYKLRCILRALKLKPVKWQKDYALGRSNILPPGRATGKTVAVMLRALMQDPSIVTVRHIISADPDYVRGDFVRWSYYRREYDRCQRICSEAGIPVPEVRSMTMQDNWRTKACQK